MRHILNKIVLLIIVFTLFGCTNYYSRMKTTDDLTDEFIVTINTDTQKYKTKIKGDKTIDDKTKHIYLLKESNSKDVTREYRINYEEERKVKTTYKEQLGERTLHSTKYYTSIKFKIDCGENCSRHYNPYVTLNSYGGNDRCHFNAYKYNYRKRLNTNADSFSSFQAKNTKPKYLYNDGKFKKGVGYEKIRRRHLEVQYFSCNEVSSRRNEFIKTLVKDNWELKPTNSYDNNVGKTTSFDASDYKHIWINKKPDYITTKGSNRALEMILNDKRYSFIKSNKYTVKRQDSIRFKIANGEYKSFTFDLYEESPAIAQKRIIKELGYGFIKLSATQNDVDIYINNEFSGKIGKNPFVKKLSPGNYHIQAKKRLFGISSINASIYKDDMLAHKFELVPSGNLSDKESRGKIVQSTGRLVVVTERNDLIININGTKHTLPVDLPNIATGLYDIQIEGPGFKRTRKVYVNKNQKTFIDLDNN